ncbi:hypothetical protein CI109_103707 [Kwoniella shandongensis]|uniref:Uncharacterized protein n=1 Tax=Kwoniella shandongensis TaxID=1734106 RepID=A0A5M6C7I0_9TREE|nr:uncharacterized protein CI109_000596 [Kwoniella shandongensis]KAA5531024.1 hypothetical protein CI109_000596 [Kwoniella shandongensis]
MDESDPITNFFPESTPSTQSTILYTALSLKPTATSDEIRKSYRKLALLHHPDKHTYKTASEREEQNKLFQKIGFAYAVLSDEGRKKRYDRTGRTDDKFVEVEEMGWEAYFESLYKRVDRKILDEDKKRYQGSEEEKEDIIEAYTSTSGSLPDILSYIPHSTSSDESRFIKLINDLISSDELTSTPKWRKSSTDEKAQAKRLKAGEKAAKEAEKAAKELGVWEEFYGNGEKGKRMNDDEQQKKDDGEGEGALQALILKRQREREGGLNRLEEKYRKIEEEERERKRAKKSKKGKKNGADDEEAAGDGMPAISDADFEALQAKMFAKKDAKDEAPAPAKKAKSKSKLRA